MTTTIVLVRHGETDWNREHRFQGHADPPLNDVGRAQALELAATLAREPFTRVYASPLRRAWETAEILAATRNLPVQPHPALEEVDVGSWSGLTVADVEARFPEGYRRWRESRLAGWEDGETFEELGLRVVSGVLALAAQNDGATLVAVTHGGPVRTLQAYVGGLSFASPRSEVGAVANCGVVRIAVRDGEIEPVD
ncbi:MAG TPA: histidine phosphatase family protein [Gaiellaceae bacterium]|nr:histidine phosphatase family protein [Gaiellaceae bacterium]